MSRNGELCLKKIIFSYSPSMGSPGVRQFFALYLPAFHEKYPQVQIDIRSRFWPESYITGLYRDGSEKSYCVKYLSPMGINIRAHRLVNEANDSNLPFSASHLNFQRRSVQGTWNPWLWTYESSRCRSSKVPHWDRKLSENEWKYYVDRYTAEMKTEEESINERVQRFTEIPDESTAEVQKRWKDYVVPSMQSDIEHNLQHWKDEHAKGAPSPRQPTLEEYMLFSVPDHTSLGQDAVDMLRRREAQDVENWWKQRGEQLVPP
eukprot:gene9357-6580_t